MGRCGVGMNVIAGLKRILALGAFVALTTSCAPPGAGANGGQNGAQNGGAGRIGGTLSSEYVQIVSVSRSLVEVESSGRLVKAAAPDGDCIPVDSIQTQRRTAFLLIHDCAGAAPIGVVSLSISAAPLTLPPDDLARFLKSDAARAGLGFGGGEAGVSVIDVEVADGVVIAMVEDKGGFGPAFAGEVICRAFMELNGRMVVATLTSLGDAPRPAEEMRAELERFVGALRAANA